MDNGHIGKKIIDFLKYQLTFGEYIYFSFQHNTFKDELKTIQNKPLDQLKISYTNSVKENLFAFEPEWKKSTNLRQLYEKINTCKNCPLGHTRINFVFGSGNSNADIMLIGEAPGADEDAQGLPFVGKAGQLLTKILASIGLKREEVYIANILKCRPPNNRAPIPSEIMECEPYLHKQIELINPKFIVILGLTAANTLLKSKLKMSEVNGKFFDDNGRKILITYHPAALLRNPNLKRPVWEHMKMLKATYDEYLKTKNSREK